MNIRSLFVFLLSLHCITQPRFHNNVASHVSTRLVDARALTSLIPAQAGMSHRDGELAGEMYCEEYKKELAVKRRAEVRAEIEAEELQKWIASCFKDEEEGVSKFKNKK